MESSEETELENLVSTDTKKTPQKHNKHFISDEGHKTHHDDHSDRKSIPSRSTSPKSDLEDGWNLVEDDLPPPDVKSGTSTPKEGQKKDSRHGGSSSSGVSWNLSLKNKVYCSLYNMYHSQPTEPPTFSQSPIWMMGLEFCIHPYDIDSGAVNHSKKSKTSSKKKVPDHAERFMEAFVNVLFFSYRKDFPKLNHLHTTTDVGWGCMVRTGQMMLAHVLSEIHHPRLGKTTVNPTVVAANPAAARMPYSRERQILKLFHDAPDTDGGHPYSIHSIIDRNSALYGIEKKDEQKNGIWFSPTKIAKVLKHLVRRHSPETLTMLVPTDGVIYVDKVIALCTAPFVPAQPSPHESKRQLRESKKKLRRSGKYVPTCDTTERVQVRRLHKHQLLASAAEAIQSAGKGTATTHDSVSESWVDVGATPLKHPAPSRASSGWNPFKSKTDDFDMEGNTEPDLIETCLKSKSSAASSRTHSRSSSRSAASSSKKKPPSNTNNKTTQDLLALSSDESDELNLDPLFESDEEADAYLSASSHSDDLSSSSSSESSIDTSDEDPDPDEDRYVGIHAESSGFFTPTASMMSPRSKDEATLHQPPNLRRTRSSIPSPRSESPLLIQNHTLPSQGTSSLSHSSDAVGHSSIKKDGSSASLLGSFSMSSDESTSDFHHIKRNVSFAASTKESSSARYWSIRFSPAAMESELPPVWRPLFILIPRRLGVSKLNPTFVHHLKAILRNPYSVGIVGGKPKASLYFVAYQDDEVLYLDPHIVRSAVHDDDEFTEEIYNSFHVKFPQKMPISALDPSMALGFLCRTIEEFEDFCNIHEQFLEESKCEPIFTIEEKSPNYDQPDGPLADSVQPGNNVGRTKSHRKAPSSSSSASARKTTSTEADGTHTRGRDKSQQQQPPPPAVEKSITHEGLERKSSMRRTARSKSPESKSRSRVETLKVHDDKKAKSEGGSPANLSDDEDFVHT